MSVELPNIVFVGGEPLSFLRVVRSNARPKRYCCTLVIMLHVATEVMQIM